MSASGTRRFGYIDRVLPDGAIERTYSNGRVERRIWPPQTPDTVAWSDNTGNQGQDRALGGGKIERTDARGSVVTGQQVGHGITVWEDGQYVTVNETPLPEPPPRPLPRPSGFAGLLVGLGLGGLFGLGGAALLARGDDAAGAEAMLYDEVALQEEELRRVAREQQAAGGTTSSSSSGGGDSGAGGGWDDNDDNGGDDNDVDSFG